MSFSNSLWAGEVIDTHEWLPDSSILNTVDIVGVWAAEITLNGGSAPSLHELPENYQPEKIGSFEDAAGFYWVDSLGNEAPTMYFH